MNFGNADIDSAEEWADHVEQNLDHFRDMRDSKASMAVTASPYDDTEELLDEIRGDGDLTVEVSASDLLQVMGVLEMMFHVDNDPIMTLHCLDLFIDLVDEHREDLKTEVGRRMDVHDELQKENGGPGGPMFR